MPGPRATASRTRRPLQRRSGCRELGRGAGPRACARWGAYVTEWCKHTTKWQPIRQQHNNMWWSCVDLRLVAWSNDLKFEISATSAVATARPGARWASGLRDPTSPPKVTGFQTGSGRMGLSQKGRRSPGCCHTVVLRAHALPHVATCCHILPHVPHIFPWKSIRGNCGTSVTTP